MRVFVLVHGTPVAERLARAFVEIALAAAVLVAAVIGGHELREWREYYPTVHHPWIDGPLPTAEAREPSSSR